MSQDVMTVKDFYQKYKDYYYDYKMVLDLLGAMYEIVYKEEYEELGEKEVLDLQILIERQIIHKEIPDEQAYYEDVLSLLESQSGIEKIEYIKEQIEQRSDKLENFKIQINGYQ